MNPAKPTSLNTSLNTALPALVLLLDSGNSRLKCRCIQTQTGALYQQFSRANHELELMVDDLRQLLGRVVGIHAVAVTSHELKQTIEQVLQQALGLACPPVQWHHSAQRSQVLRNHYEPIHHLGNDRWFGMIGVLSHARPAGAQLAEQVMSKPILYISFGTATTIDTIVGQDFLGGLIFPGVDLMQQSLKQGTAQLPLVAIGADTPVDSFPRGTQAAIIAGIVAAQVGAIMRQCLLIQEQHQVYPDIYVAGGARAGILPELRRMLNRLELLSPSQQASITIHELEAPVLDGLHYHYMNDYLGK